MSQKTIVKMEAKTINEMDFFDVTETSTSTYSYNVEDLLRQKRDLEMELNEMTLNYNNRIEKIDFLLSEFDKSKISKKDIKNEKINI